MQWIDLTDFPTDFEITGSSIGTLTHRLIAAVAAHQSHASSEQVLLSVANLIRIDRPSVDRQSLITSATTLAGTYFREFSLASSRFVGAEVFVGDRPVDLLWMESGSSRFWIDEIKSGLASGFSTEQGARVQAKDLAELGRGEFGDRFAGVRVLKLQRPRSSYVISSTGETGPVGHG